MALNIPVKSPGDQFLSGELNEIVSTVDSLSAAGFINQIVVTQANYLTTLGGVIDSDKEYFLDGIINMGSTLILVPSGGIKIRGYNFVISGLTSAENDYTLFTSPVGGSGDILWNDFHIDISGTNSMVSDLTADVGNEAFEIIRINFNNCTSLGELNGYRQGLETGTGRFGGTPNLILSGTWIGGYFIDTSIVRFLDDGSYSLFEEGTSFTMASRFRSNQNIDLPANVSFLDFQSSNFTNPSILQLQGCLVSREGVFNASDVNLTPNIDASDLVSLWQGNNGLPNTFVGAQATVTSEAASTISVIDTFVDLNGTFTASDMQHFDAPANGQLRHLGDSPREYRVSGQHVLSSTDGDIVNLKIVVWRQATTSFEDAKTTSRVIDRLQGARNVAYFVLIDNIILNKNDYVKLQVSNSTSEDDITSELGGFEIVEAR
jgi:hypothetical protein